MNKLAVKTQYEKGNTSYYNYIEKKALSDLFLRFIDTLRAENYGSSFEPVYDKVICFTLRKNDGLDINIDSGPRFQVVEFSLTNIQVIEREIKQLEIPRMQELGCKYREKAKASFKERIKILFKGSC